MNASDENALRLTMCHVAQQLVARGLNHGTAGNLCVRCGEKLLVTPSGMPVDAMAPETMVALDFEKTLSESTSSNIKPTSEWRMHRDILAARPDVNAVIHTHAMFATTLACLHRDIPPFHYMIAVAGGDSIRCAPYALFGTQVLSDHALAALEGRLACLLAHHGMIALGRDLDHALAVAEEVEALCEQFWRILQIDEPKLLTATQMQEVLEQFKDYGQWKTIPSALQEDIVRHTNLPPLSQIDIARDTNIPSPSQGEG